MGVIFRVMVAPDTQAQTAPQGSQGKTEFRGYRETLGSPAGLGLAGYQATQVFLETKVLKPHTDDCRPRPNQTKVALFEHLFV